MSIVGISVDYAATGLGHTDRVPSRVCLARDGEIIYDTLIAVPNLEDTMEAYTQIDPEALRAAEKAGGDEVEARKRCVR